MGLYVGDIKAVIEIEFRDYEDIDGVLTDKAALDISTGVSEISFIFLKPDGITKVTKKKSLSEVVLSGTGTDGKARYETQASFIDSFGIWKIQGLVEFATGAKHYSSIKSFVVSPIL